MNNRYNVWLRCTEKEYAGQWGLLVSNKPKQWCEGYASALRMNSHTVVVSKQSNDKTIEKIYQRRLKRIFK